MALVVISLLAVSALAFAAQEAYRDGETGLVASGDTDYPQDWGDTDSSSDWGDTDTGLEVESPYQGDEECGNEGDPDGEIQAFKEEIRAACEAEGGCPEGEPLTDEDLERLGVVAPLDSSYAWGICEIVDKTTCKCTDTISGGGGPDYDEDHLVVGKNGGQFVYYDTIACRRYHDEDTGWSSWDNVGGCRKVVGNLEDLVVWGSDEKNKIVTRRNSYQYCNECIFADWWSSADYWDSVEVDAKDGGPDTIYASPQDDVLKGGEIVWGQEGDDEIRLDDDNQTNPVARGFNGEDYIGGTGNDDYLYGGANDDTIEGGGGDDTIYGKLGNDDLYGEGGDDNLYGNEGYDKLYGGSGYDKCDCGPDSDPECYNCDEENNCDD